MLAAENIIKSFGGTRALENVSLRLEPGEIHGLIGENGAGKSTLVKALCGVHRIDSGAILIDDKIVSNWSPKTAIANGLITVHQDVNLIETMTVAENIFLNAELTKGVWIDKRKMTSESVRLLARLEVDIEPQLILGTLPIDLRKMVQLARALRQNPKVLLLDEPTSSLTSAEVDILIKQVKIIAASGVGVLYISHYLNEVFEHAHSLTILRDGSTAWQGRTKDITISTAIEKMIGKKLHSPIKRISKAAQETKPALQLNNISLKNKLIDVSFSVKPGEIFGIGGLVGAGLSDLARCIFSDTRYRYTSGEILVDGRRTDWASPEDAMRDGLALVTSDRHNTGALLDFSIMDNISLPSLNRFSSRVGVLRLGGLADEVERQVESLSVKCANTHSALSTLSGGNQQKVMLGKWFMTNPRVLILDEPTIGVDVGAKQAIKDIICRRADEGCAIIILSTEMEELAEIADRAIVLFRGRVVARLDTQGFTYTELTRAANNPFEINEMKIDRSLETVK